MTSDTQTGALSAFLKENKEKFLADVKKDGAKSWTVVMGNEAGDLDSCASAVAYSFLTPQKPAIGLIQTPRPDLILRAENIEAFSLAKVDLDDLLCLDDIPISSPSELQSSYALVDHNSLLPQFVRKEGETKVVGIIDHHEDERQHLDANPRNITTPLGSCASLVAETFKDAFEPSPSEDNATVSTPAPKELATLLLTAIYIDTGGLKPKGKGVALDNVAATILESYDGLPDQGSLSGQAAEDSFRHSTAEKLGDMKHSVAHLSSRDLLRRDYKEYQFVTTASATPIRVGLSTVPFGTKAWLKKEKNSTPSYRASLDAWAKERQLDVVGVLNSFHNDKDKKRRELVLLVGGAVPTPASQTSSSDAENVKTIFDALRDGLEAHTEFELDKVKLKDEFEAMKAEDEDEVAKLIYWKQGNNDATRKLIAPAFKSIIEGLEGVKSTLTTVQTSSVKLPQVVPEVSTAAEVTHK